MARTNGDGGFTDLSRDSGGMIDTRDAPRYDRPVFSPLPRDTRGTRVRPVYRVYPRKASR